MRTLRTPLRMAMSSLGLAALILMSSGCTDSKQTASPRVPSSPAPAVLTLHATMTHDVLYAGDSLALRIQLMSPRDNQAAQRAARARESGQASSPPEHRFIDRVPADWADHLRFTLVRLGPDGRREAVVAEGTWREWRLISAELNEVLRIADPFAEWLIPSADAQLTAGRYAVEAQWNGAETELAADLANALLSAPTIEFEVRTPSSAAERAKHAARRAQQDFQSGRYQPARTLAQESLRLDPNGALDPDRIATYLIVARASLALGDTATATETYRTLLNHLSPPDANDLAAAIEQQLANIAKGL